MAEENKKELVVIGAGPGGYSAAFRAADFGLKVTLIDPAKHPGGTCLYHGCIPSKSLLDLLQQKHYTAKGTMMGLQYDELNIDVRKVAEWKHKVVSNLTEGLGMLSEERSIEYIRGSASFVSEHELEVETTEGEKTTIRFENAIIATGSAARELSEVKYDHKVIVDSSDALELKDIPENMLVIGGGFIGHEIGSIYTALGSAVSLAEPEDTLLSWIDQDLVEVFEKDNEGIFERVHLGTRVEHVKVKDGKAKVSMENEDGEIEKEYDQVLVVMGRVPNSSWLRLEKAGVEVDEEGFVKVDDKRKTSTPNIYAIGDVAAKPQYANKASYEGRVVAEVIAGKEGAVYDPKAIPCVVATTASEIAWCGLMETQAKEEGIKVNIARFPWQASGKAVLFGDTNGLTKLILEPGTERILGGGTAGKNAGALISEISLAIEMAATARDVSLTIHPHPTLSETITGAARDYLGSPTYKTGK